MDDHISEKIIEDVSSKCANHFCIKGIHLLTKADGVNNVSDGTLAYCITGINPEEKSILIVSNRKFADFMEKAAEKAFGAYRQLSKEAGSHICAPYITGKFEERSYAIFPHYESYSDNRVLRKAEIFYTERSITSWLVRVFQETADEHPNGLTRDELFLGPLEKIGADTNLADCIRASAFYFSEKLMRGEIRPHTCLEHGDFWTGNILFTRSSFCSPLTGKFRVIDWAGSRLDGYPGIDCLRFLLSGFGSRAYSAHRLSVYGQRIGMSNDELAFHCFCALGRLSENLNQFPRDRFNTLVSSVVEFLAKNKFITEHG